MKKKALYTGTFDPITNGHIDIAIRASYLFDVVIVGIALSTDKNVLFSLEERVAMAQKVFSSKKNIKVISFSGLLADFFDQIKADVVVRGLRAVSDFEYEFQMAEMNRQLNHMVETIFITSSAKYTCLSSTMIRHVAKIDPNRIAHLVPIVVLSRLKEVNTK